MKKFLVVICAVLIGNAYSNVIGQNNMQNKFFNQANGLGGNINPALNGISNCGLQNGLANYNNVGIGNANLVNGLGNANGLAVGVPMVAQSGYGDVGVTGELAVGGQTAILGNVPVIGYITFEGNVPAGGTVALSSNCGCNANNIVL